MPVSQHFWPRPKTLRYSFLFRRNEMSDDVQVAKVLDLKGLACPMPIVKVSKGIKEVEVGQIIEAQTTDPGSLTDFPAWAKTSGNEIVKTDQEEKLIKFFIKRLA